MPLYDCGDRDCDECQRAFGPNRDKAIKVYEAREAYYAKLQTAIKKDIRAYGFRLLDEAEHAEATGATEAQFAATAGAAVIQTVLEIFNSHSSSADNSAGEGRGDGERASLESLSPRQGDRA